MACFCSIHIDDKLELANARLASGFSMMKIGDGLSPARHAPVLIKLEKINPKGIKPPVVMATFCPFCGLKYEGAP